MSSSFFIHRFVALLGMGAFWLGSFVSGALADSAPAKVASTSAAALTTEARRLVSLPLAPPEASVSSRLQPQKAFIGDRLLYELRVTAPESWTADLSAVGPMLQSAGFQILDYERLSTEKGKDGATVGLRFFISTYALGKYEIPAIPVGLRSADGRRWRLDSRPFQVEVVPVERKPGEPDDIRDIKDPLDVAPPFPGAWLLVGLAMLLGGSGIWYLRRRGDEVDQILITPLSAWEIALSQLAELDESGMREAHRLRDWHYRISTILREYLSRRFALAIMSETSSELLEGLHEAASADRAEAVLGDEGFRSLLEGFLGACDRVKFARYHPSADEVGAVRTRADSLLALTRPVVEAIVSEDEEVVVEEEGETP